MAEKKAKAPGRAQGREAAGEGRPKKAPAPKAAKPAAKKAAKPAAEKPARKADRSTVDVVNAENKKVRELKLSPGGVRVRGQRPPALRGGQAVPRGRAARHAHDQEPRARLRLGQEALAAEGHRPRPRGRDRATPLWRHGGTVFGPMPRDYSYTMPKKARAAALRSALSQRVNEGALKVVDGLPGRGAEDEGAEGHPRQARRRGQDGARGPRAHGRPRALRPQHPRPQGGGRHRTSPSTTSSTASTCSSRRRPSTSWRSGSRRRRGQEP